MKRLLVPGALLAVVLLAPACKRPPPPPTNQIIQSADTILTVFLDPFALTLTSAGGAAPFRAEGAVFEVGTVDAVDRSHFYDPSFDDGVRWSGALTVKSYEKASNTLDLVLENADASAVFDLNLAAEGDGAFTFALTPRAIDRVVQTRFSFTTDPDDRFYGLGEWFDDPEHHGKRRTGRFDVDTTVEAGYNMRHVKVPQLISTAGWGVLLTDPEVYDADLTDPTVGRLTLVKAGMSGHLVRARTPLDVVARLNQLAGLPPIWPKWAFGPMQWRNEHKLVCADPCDQGCNATETGQDVVMKDAQAMRDLDLPGSVIWVDAPWETGFNTFEFNPVQFPDAQQMIDDLHALGYRVMVWTSPFMNDVDDSALVCGMSPTASKTLYAEAKDKGYLVVNDGGTVVELPWRSTSGALVDFSNPDARAWWKTQARKVLDMGVEGFKMDFDDYVVPSIGDINLADNFIFSSDDDGHTGHSRYSAWYHQAAAEALAEGSQEGFIIARTGNAFDGAWTGAIWPGDLGNDFRRHLETDGTDKPATGGLPAAVSAAVSLAASNHAHFGSDIGGYRGGQPDKETLGRWIQVGALSTIMQLGGAGEHHNPWDLTVYDQELLDLYRKYARLHLALFPYLYHQVSQHSETGQPILRALGLQFPRDLAAADAKDQYMFGPDLLVAPVVERDARQREVVFPEGDWIDWWTFEIHTGPGQETVDAPFDHLPLFVRAGAALELLPPEVDTLAPATDPTVVSLEDTSARIFRVHPKRDVGFTGADGTLVQVRLVEGGVDVAVGDVPEFRTFTFQIHWAMLSATAPTAVSSAALGALTPATDLPAFEANPVGAWFYDATTGVVYVGVRTTQDRVSVR